MIYPYKCTVCYNDFEVIKPLRNIDDIERCGCGGLGERCISRFASFSKLAAGDWDTAHYNPAFGQRFRNNGEAKKEAKRLGFTEVGTEPVEKIHKKFDGDRQKKIETRYDGINDLGSIGKL